MTLIRKEYDVVVVGSGGSGSAAAETAVANGMTVLLVSKDPIVCSDSKISEGIMTVRASGSPKDSEQELSSNLRIQGDDISEPGLTESFARDSQSSYDWLRAHGITPRINPKTGQPQPLTIAMGGHSMPRSIDHQNGGLDYAHACWRAVTKGSLDYLEDAWFLDLYTGTDHNSGRRRVHGGLIYHASTGDFISVNARAVVLASGGLSTLYFPKSDTMRGNTGDAYAIAARAGAQLVDMEQVQFIPFAVANAPSFQGLTIGEPIIAGVLGVIRDKDGNVLSSEIMGRTRAECSAAIARAVANGKGTENGGCYLDLTENSKGQSGIAYTELMKDKVPNILKIVRGAMGAKAARFQEPWEVRPSAHYLMGGVRATEHCQVLDSAGQPIVGLFVAGQAMGGLHGSNRLGSTSLAEGITFGRRAGQSATACVRSLPATSWNELTGEELTHCHFYRTKLGRSGSSYPVHLLRRLQENSWSGLGPARTESGIERTLINLMQLNEEVEHTRIDSDTLWNQALIDYVECRNLLLCAEAIALSAKERKHSLGAHVRLDNERVFDLQHFSTACHLEDERLSSSRLRRTRSPVIARTKLKLKQSGRILLFRLLRSLPRRLSDPVLYRIYIRALGYPLQSETNGSSTRSDTAEVSEAKEATS